MEAPPPISRPDITIPSRHLSFFIEQGSSPATCDVAFASTDGSGNPGQLNHLVLTELGYRPSDLPSRDRFESGFVLLALPKRSPVMLIVTIGVALDGRATAEALRRNLEAALRQHAAILSGKRLWVPLMGTGAGKLQFEDSLRITLEAFGVFAPARETEVHLSLPPASDLPESAIGGFRMTSREILRGTFKSDLARTVTFEEPGEQGADTAALSSAPEVLSSSASEPRDRPPSTRLHADRWTAEDSLGYAVYAHAIEQFIRHRDTRPPLVVSVQAPWGQGKTSLMRMLQERLDPENSELADPQRTKSAAQDDASITYKALRQSLDQGRSEFKPRRRAYPTVWFNAWKYQSSEEVWAGLAHAMLSQLSARLPPLERAKFWLELQLGRVDREQLRRDLLVTTVEKLVPRLFRWTTAALGCLLVGGVTLATLPIPLEHRAPLGLVMSLVGALGGLVKAGMDWNAAHEEALGRKLEGKLGAYLRQPNYEGRLGFLHLVEEDMRRALELLVSPEEPAVVFIDDLDRCSPSRVAQVIEAMNLFLAGSFPGCIFVLGIDAEMVAAAMEVTHAAVIGRLGERRQELGWRFLDKFVQLPFVIPRPESALAYLDALHRSQRPSPPPPEAQAKARQILEQAQRKALKADAITEDVRALAMDLKESDPKLLREVSEAVVKAGAEDFSDQSDELRRVFEPLEVHLTDNPRTIKRAVNLYRFHRFLGWANLSVRPAQAAATPEEMARWVVVLVRWPAFVRWLQERAEDREVEPMLKKVVQTAREAVEVSGWQKQMEKDGIAAGSWGGDADLLRFLREEAADAPSLARAGGCGLW